MNPIEAIWNLFFKDGEAQKYHDDPEAYLHETGLDQVPYEEIPELVGLAYEKGPVNQGAYVTVGGNQSVGGSHQHAGGATSGGTGGTSPTPAMTAPPSPPPPPPPMDPHLPPAEALQQTINYYVTNNTTTNVDDRDTNVDSSVNTNVLAGDGADIELDLDSETNTASGDGAVAAGDNATGVATGANAVAAGEDINAPVNTGTVDDSILADESTFEGVAVGDGAQAISESEGAATGGGDGTFISANVTASDQADISHLNFGSGNSADYTETNTDSFNEDNDDHSTDDSYNEQSQVGDESFSDQFVDQSFDSEPAAAAAVTESADAGYDVESDQPTV